MTIHLKTHTDEKNFHCSVCKISFKTKKYCNDHERRHKKFDFEFVVIEGPSKAEVEIKEEEKGKDENGMVIKQEEKFKTELLNNFQPDENEANEEIFDKMEKVPIPFE